MHVVLLITTTVELFIVDDVDDDDDEDPKNLSIIITNFWKCALEAPPLWHQTTAVRTKPLWVYSHLKSDFFFGEKVTECDLALY